MLFKQHICFFEKYIFTIIINIYAVMKYVVFDVNMLFLYMYFVVAYMLQLLQHICRKNNIYAEFQNYINDFFLLHICRWLPGIYVAKTAYM